MNCTRGSPACKFEFRLSDDQMNHAIRKATLYSRDKSPYNMPAYPYVWIRESDSIRLDMGPDETGRNLIATFVFDKTPLRAGIVVHLAVWIATNPHVNDWGAVPSADTRIHAMAANHFKVTLLGAPGTLVARIEPPSPPLDDTPPPPLSPDGHRAS